MLKTFGEENLKGYCSTQKRLLEVTSFVVVGRVSFVLATSALSRRRFIPTTFTLQQTISDLKQQLATAHSLIRNLRKQNDRIARVNVDLIRELHAFALKYGAVEE